MRPASVILRPALLALALLPLLAPADAGAIGRKAAEKRAKQVLKLGNGAEVLFGLPKPLPVGATVNEVLAKGVGNAKLKRTAWLFWHDQQFGALFQHPSRYILLDGRSGKVVRNARTSMFPLVNGRRPAFLATRAAYRGNRFRVAASKLARSTPLAGPSSLHGPWARLSAPALTKQDLAADCLITIGDKDERALDGSFKAMKDWADSVGLARSQNDPATAGQLRDAVEAFHDQTKCRDVFIFIAGHGTPAPGTRIRNLPRGVTVPPSGFGPARVAVRVNKTGRRVTSVDYLTPKNLADIMSAFPDMQFKVKIESCFSGRFKDELGGKVANLRVLETSSANDEVSFGALGARYYKAGTRRLVDNTIPNPDGAGEFTNGDVIGLTQWANSQQELDQYGRGLAEGIARSAEIAKTNDFAQVLGQTHGQLYYQPPPPPAKNEIAGATWVHHPSEPRTNLCVYVTGAAGATGEVDLNPKPGLDTAPKPFTLDANGRAMVVFKINQATKYTATATWGGQGAQSSDVTVTYPAAGPAPPSGHAACPAP